MIDQAPLYRKVATTLRKIVEDPMFAKNWYVKVADGGDPFVVPLNMYIAQFKSENHPDLDVERTAFFNKSENVVLLTTGYINLPVVTLLNWKAALDYIDSRVFE